MPGKVRTITVTSKGQVTLSSAARKQLGLQKGAALREIVIGNCLILMPQNELADQIRQRAQHALRNAGVSIDELTEELERSKEERFNTEFPDLASG
jgi:bifunctional DNA-binding transcriptional regulator/antitoxin component of YhaV-PrlF toxin-antitoxin module